MTDWCEIFATPLDAGRAVQFVTGADCGGIAVFLGTTRAEARPGDHTPLAALDYEAYDAMALRQLNDLATRARARWPMILRQAILHRVGRVGLGEPSVCIAVGTPHRAEAFDACRWLIDTLKAEVAIWKREFWQDGGGTWVDATPAGE